MASIGRFSVHEAIFRFERAHLKMIFDDRNLNPV